MRRSFALAALVLALEADHLTFTGVFAGSSRLTRYEDMQPADAGTLEVQPGATIRFDRP